MRKIYNILWLIIYTISLPIQITNLLTKSYSLPKLILLIITTILTVFCILEIINNAKKKKNK